MVKMDPNADLFPTGMFLFEVIETTVKFTKERNHERWIVTLEDVHTGRSFSEGWMMEGDGASMSVRKLKSLGVTDFNDVNPSDIKGRRMIARVKHSPPKNGYEAKAETGTTWPESNPPKELEAPLSDRVAKQEQAIEDKAQDAFFATKEKDPTKPDDTPF